MLYVYIVGGIIGLLFIVWIGFHAWIIACGIAILLRMDWNRWYSYEEMMALTKYPSLFVQLTLPDMIRPGLIMVEPDSAIEDKAEILTLLNEDEEGENIFAVLEDLRFRRIFQPRRRGKRRPLKRLAQSVLGVGSQAPQGA